MSEAKSLARPRQVTTAGVMGVVGSALIVVSLFDALQRLRSVEMRQAVDTFLAEPPGDGLGVSTAEALDLLHGLVLLNGALAAAAAVLAVYVFQRHHAARIGFSIVAGLLLLASPFSGGVTAMVVGFAAVMLWSRPARDWFAGRPAAPVGNGEAAARPALPVQPERPVIGQQDPQADPPESATEPRPAPATYPFGSPPPAAWVPPGVAPRSPYASPPDPHWAPPASATHPTAPAAAAAAEGRPTSVVVAAAVTWLCAGVAALMFALVIGMLMFAQAPLVEAIRADARFGEAGVSVDDLLAAAWVVSAIAIFWSVSALALAVLAFRRLGWARVLLAVSAGMTVLFGLVALPAGLLVAVPAVAVVALLFSGGANAWYAGRAVPRGPAGPAAPLGRAAQPSDEAVQRPGRPPVW
jgi:hypothetical protein